MNIDRILNPGPDPQFAVAAPAATPAAAEKPLTILFKRAQEDFSTEELLPEEPKSKKASLEKAASTLRKNDAVIQQVEKLIQAGHAEEAKQIAKKAWKESRGSTRMRDLYIRAGGHPPAIRSHKLQRSEAEIRNNKLIENIQSLYDANEKQAALALVQTELKKGSNSDRLRKWRKKLLAENVQTPQTPRTIRIKADITIETTDNVALEALMKLNSSN